MNILIIDGQGGGMGRQLVEEIKKSIPDAVITAVGTNSLATQAMIKAGANHAATGENAVIVGCRTADYIVGPIGIVVADSLFGEITPEMAKAIGQSNAERILLPVSQCRTSVVGIAEQNISNMLKQVVSAIKCIDK